MYTKTIMHQIESMNVHKEILVRLCRLIQGTQSANPHNDYCQHFVDTGERPQNFIRDVGSLSSNILCT